MDDDDDEEDDDEESNEKNYVERPMDKCETTIAAWAIGGGVRINYCVTYDLVMKFNLHTSKNSSFLAFLLDHRYTILPQYQDG